MKSLCVVLAIVFAMSVEAAPREKRQLFGGLLAGFLGDGDYQQGNPYGGYFGYNQGNGNDYSGYSQGFRGYSGFGRGTQHERFQFIKQLCCHLILIDYVHIVSKRLPYRKSNQTSLHFVIKEQIENVLMD
ncbi:hypothetical protein DAPPUDRAFT_109659 [Daphnia pulex]|uniref:Uncharacterized protein n=1 Tax=Daphnia pulex TaxID=6669 RepID=E9H3R9_DAPPU|nr:hypothetical protein DAPPUDRAFT_109659 [Daphnia pulex]|eukprot:EFX73566.1 hypothetical protein DAPPUDRAFT_109659 [Daphnia pulex]